MDSSDSESGIDGLVRFLETVSASPRIVLVARNGFEKDSLTMAGLFRIVSYLRLRNLEIDFSELPKSVGNLLTLSMAVPRRESTISKPDGALESFGRSVFSILRSSRGYLEFFGEFLVCCLRFVRGKARYRRQDFWEVAQECSSDALPIVSLISILVGMILAFVGGAQLQRFGASLFVADLVGLAMTREMGCMMTGVIMSGRTGASFAAQLGSMKVNEEIDALQTLGLSPMEFLVLPRVFALGLIMPLLTLYSDLLGCIGGVFVSLAMDISPEQFYIQLHNSLTLTHIAVGFFKAFAFGGIVALSGCYYGMNSGRSSSSVGNAATSAVVVSITWIIVFDAVAAVLLQVFGI